MRRLVVPWSGLVVAVLTVLALVGATLPAEAKAATTSFVYVESDPGDISGRGLTFLAAQPSATISVQGSKKGPDLLVTADDHGHSFTFWVDRDLPDRVTTGVHEFGPDDPGGYEFSAALPRGEGGNLRGTLDIRQLEFSRDGLHVRRLDLTFTAYDSEFGSGGLRGHLAYRSTKSVDTPGTAAVLHTGEWLSHHRELRNAEGVTGGQEHGNSLQRLTLAGDRAVLLRRDWPDTDDTHVDAVGWSTPTAGSKGDRLYLSASGRLSLRAGEGETVWSVRPKGAGKGTFLLVNHDGRLMLVDARFRELWSVG